MKHLLIRVAQPLLALLIFAASALCAESTPETVAARQRAAELLPKLQAGSWEASALTIYTINELTRSGDPADEELADKLAGLCAAAFMQGIQSMPQPPLQEVLLGNAETLADWLLRHPTSGRVQHAREIVAVWERQMPENVRVRLLRLELHVLDSKTEELVRLAAALADEKELEANNRRYVRDVYVSALLRDEPPSTESIQCAEAMLNRWRKEDPQDLRARMLLVELHYARKDWPAQYALASELLADEKITGLDRHYVQQRRLEGALNTGKTQELNAQDWIFIMEQLTGRSDLKQFISEHGQLLLGIAFGLGWLWFFIVAWITRSLRAKPPGFWITTLWSTVTLYASLVIMAPAALRILLSLLGVAFLIFATSGHKAPLGYLVPPQRAGGAGRARWLPIVGWCVAGLLVIQLVSVLYAVVYARVMHHPLGSQYIAKLLRADTPYALAAMVLAGGILVPFLEEVVFRGLLQDAVGRWLPPRWCVAVVAILFGLLHGVEMAIPITFMGVLFSLLRLLYRSLLPCILLHSLNNSAMIVLIYFAPEVL